MTASVKDIATAVRRAAVAGQFYPAEPSSLQQAVQRYLATARSEQTLPAGKVRAVIAPHAGYICSGPVAGHSFAALAATAEADAAYTVYLMGPAHWLAVNGVGLSLAPAFQTSLGDIPVAVEIVQELAALGEPFHVVNAAHAPEHCLEVELPFLQIVLPRCCIVPMLLDEAADPQCVAQELAGRVAGDPCALMVISSDLSHFSPYAEAVARDRQFLDAVVRGDVAGVQAGQACGALAILCLMAVAQQLGWTPHLLKYLNSGDTCGPRHGVVGYGAVAYTQPA